MSHFGDVMWNVLSLVGLGTTVWFGSVCWRKMSHALSARKKPLTKEELRTKWGRLPIEQR